MRRDGGNLDVRHLFLRDSEKLRLARRSGRSVRRHFLGGFAAVRAASGNEERNSDADQERCGAREVSLVENVSYTGIHGRFLVPTASRNCSSASMYAASCWR